MRREDRTRIERSDGRRRRRKIGEERETREKMSSVKRVGQEGDLVKRRREGSTLKEMRDVVPRLIAAGTNVYSLPVKHRLVGVDAPAVAGAELRQCRSPRPWKR